jgi:hypothetical protein
MSAAKGKGICKPSAYYFWHVFSLQVFRTKPMTAEDFDRDVENVGRLPGKSEVQGSTGLLLGTVFLIGNYRESKTFMPAFFLYQYNDTVLL